MQVAAIAIISALVPHTLIKPNNNSSEDKYFKSYSAYLIPAIQLFSLKWCMIMYDKDLLRRRNYICRNRHGNSLQQKPDGQREGRIALMYIL